MYVVLKPGVKAEDIDLEDTDLIPEAPTLLDFNFKDKETDDLVDMTAMANKHMKAIEKWVKMSKTVLQGRGAEPTFDTPTVMSGHDMQCVWTEESRTAFDTEGVKEEMGEDWYRDHCKTSTHFKMVFKPVES